MSRLVRCSLMFLGYNKCEWCSIELLFTLYICNIECFRFFPFTVSWSFYSRLSCLVLEWRQAFLCETGMIVDSLRFHERESVETLLNPTPRSSLRQIRNSLREEYFIAHYSAVKIISRATFPGRSDIACGNLLSRTCNVGETRLEKRPAWRCLRKGSFKASAGGNAS